MNSPDYYLGLDIGTDSIGYAVTDKDYGIMKYKGEPAWGVHLFDEANLSTERRAFRTARRRLDRRQHRVALVRELFTAEIAKVDPGFFVRLQKSSLYRDEAEEAFTLFNDAGYTDCDYHREYPTIHHLIVELMKSDAPHDIRLVYLACAWLVAHRGHFLNEIAKENVSQITDFQRVYDGFIEFFSDNEFTVPWKNGSEIQMGNILRKSCPLKQKYRELATVCFGGKTPKLATEAFPYNCDELFKCLCGGKVSAEKLFVKDEYAEINSFSLGDDEDSLAAIIGQLGDDAGLIEALKSIYDWSLLVDILGTARTISESEVAVYEQHGKDLRNIKAFVRKYAPDKYKKLFRDAEGNGYTEYSGHADNAPVKKKAGKDDFYKTLRAVVKNVKPDDADALFYSDMMQRIELQSFLPKQRDTDNRVIPYQLYWHELDLILKNAEKYLPFLTDKEDGLSVSDKLRHVFAFRIPYYVGPLNETSGRSWVKWTSKKSGRVFPWNFEKVVDLDASEQEFIRRMTNTCTYLPGERVLPKDSLAYHRFEVLNEINKIKIDEIPITVEQKQALYNAVFMGRNKVTRKRIENWLISSGIMLGNQKLSGIDEHIKSDLKPQHDFSRLLQSGVLTEADAEAVIERTAYTEDKPRLMKWLAAHYPQLSKDDIAYLSRLHYKDFGRLSQRFLNQLEGVSRETGEVFTVLGALWNTNCNLMELLSENFTFAEEIQAEQQAYYAANPQTLTQRLDDMYISNAVKRPVIRTLEIVKEVTKAFNGAPKKIFIEMARGAAPDKKGKRTTTRREQLLALYDSIKSEDVRLFQKQLEEMGADCDNRLQSDRLYLYFLQLGRCLYTGKAIDITQIAGSRYNIEHIYPRSMVKDDSILNNEILVYSEVNGQKSDTYPVNAAIQNQCAPLWHMLNENHLLSDEKLRRLTRVTPFSDDEKWGFINRQLTETTQSTKAVATLLKEKYPDTEIVYVKARLSSEFRQEFECIKSRTFNDLHHAKDAYLNIVTGNVYSMKFSKRWFVPRSGEYSVKVKTIFTNDVRCGNETVWRGKEDLAKVKAALCKNNAHITRYAFCRHGGYFDQMPVKASASLIPRKANLPTEKYGGYNKPAISFFAPVRYYAGKKSEIIIMSVELLYADKFINDDDYALTYARERVGCIIGKSVDKVAFPVGKRVLKVNTVLQLDGFKVCIAGSASAGRCLIASSLVPFVADRKTERYVKRLESFCEKRTKNEHLVCNPLYDKITREENMQLYDLYIQKLSSTIYQKRINNPLEIIEKGRDKFSGLPVEQQAQTLLNIHAVFGRISSGCDLSAIDGAPHAAATVSFSATISNWRKKYTDVRIVDEAASGLWCKKSDNLLDLL